MKEKRIKKKLTKERRKIKVSLISLPHKIIINLIFILMLREFFCQKYFQPKEEKN